MNKLLTPLSAFILAFCAVAAAQAVTPVKGTGTAASQAASAAKDGAAKPAARIQPSAASANQAGVSPAKMKEESRVPPKQNKQTEAQSNSSQ